MTNLAGMLLMKLCNRSKPRLSRDNCKTHNAIGMSKNKTNPEMRCMIEVMAGKGNRMVKRFKFLGLAERTFSGSLKLRLRQNARRLYSWDFRKSNKMIIYWH